MDSTEKLHIDTDQTVAPEDVLVVGIGASAGGIEAMRRFFGAVPPAPDGVAFVIIMHLDPERESQLAEVLQHRTPLPVAQLTKRRRIEPGRVYVIPPNRGLLVGDGHLTPSNFEKPRGHRAPIDLFFRSLAHSPEGGVAIVMSGGGSDGAVGLKAVKEAGGLVLAQEPEEAAHDSMPLAAIATGLVDFVLPAAELAEKVMRFRGARRRIRVPHDPGALPRQDEQALTSVLGHLRSRTGHDFADYKRSTVLRRIERRMQAHHVESLGQYLDFLRSHPPEAQALLKSLLISVTQFFRDAASWDLLAEQVVTPLLEGDPDRQLRVWVPGCATGEEAYSVAMLFREKADELQGAPDIQVFASDLDEHALAFGRHGIYPAAIEADVSDERLGRFFAKQGSHYQVNRELRDRVLFASHNLLKDPPFSKLDLVTCRNLLIYLNRDLQEKAFRIFRYALRPGGYLFLGSAETVSGPAAFEPLVKSHRIFARRPTDEPTRLPALDFTARGSDTRRRQSSSRAPHTAGAVEMQRHRHMLEHGGPPSLTVGRGHEILHLSQGAGRYLQRPGGHPSDDVLREIRPEMRLDLQAALVEAFDHGRATSTRPIRVEFNGDVGWVHVIVQPDAAHETPERALVLFAEVEATGIGATAPSTDGSEAEPRDPRVRQLEAEVHRLRDRLQVTIEEYESSKEEMRAANEELQSINEEYKSTAEELETSKEELQSVNEELETLNEELKGKVEELAHANSDLRNLMAATEVGTLFLDRELRIQRYTPHITELFNVMPGDVGRPIVHLTNEIHYDALAEDAERVLEELAPLEREVRGRGGKWFLMRMRPYRTVEDRIEGLVVTFLDITGRREQERARRKAEERYRLLVENVREYAIITLDTDALIATWNIGSQRLFGYSEEEAIGRPGAIIFTPEDREAGADRRELEIAVETGQASDERWHLRKDGSRFWGTGVTTALYLPDGELRGFAKVMRDNTERKAAQQALEDLAESLEDRVRERTRQVRELVSTLTMAEQQERNRVARILHSDLQQILYSIQMKLTMLRDAEDADGDLPDQAGLQEVESWVSTALATTRRLTIDLSPPVLEDEGLAEALLWLRTLMAELHGLDVRIEADGPVFIPDEDWRVLLFQAVRELLFNVVKHAEIDSARVELAHTGSELVIAVIDEGRGFDVAAAAERRAAEGNLGLAGIAERLELFGGRLEIDSAPGEGTRVRVYAAADPAQPAADMVSDAVAHGAPVSDRGPDEG